MSQLFWRLLKSFIGKEIFPGAFFYLFHPHASLQKFTSLKLHVARPFSWYDQFIYTPFLRKLDFVVFYQWQASILITYLRHYRKSTIQVFFYDLTFLVSWNVRSFHFAAKAVARNNAKREHALCCMQLDAQMNQFDWIKVGWQRNHSSMWPKPRLRQDAVDCPLPFTDSCSSLISSLCVFLIAGTRAWLNRFACTTIRVLEQGRQRRPRQKTMTLIGWMRKNNRAARAFVQFFDVMWHLTMWNFLV